MFSTEARVTMSFSTTMPVTELLQNLASGHNYIGRAYLGHNYDIGHNCIGRNYTGHTYIGNDSIGQS